MTGDAERLGLYGFGASAHIVAQVAKHQGRKLFAFTRAGDEQGQAFARSLGADWAGSSDDTPPEPLDAAIIFAPVGALVPSALAATARGGIVVCAGIHMSDVPSFPYELLWGERSIRSVANLTRRDGEEFLELAPRVPVRTVVQLVPAGARRTRRSTTCAPGASRARPSSASLLLDHELRFHPPRAMVGDRAPEHVATGRKRRAQVGGVSRQDLAERAVPSDAFSFARRPNSVQRWTSTRSASPRDSRSRWNASSVSAVSLSESLSSSACCAWVSYIPGASSVTQRSGSPIASMAASPAILRGNWSFEVGYVTELPKLVWLFPGANGRSCVRSRNDCEVMRPAALRAVSLLFSCALPSGPSVCTICSATAPSTFCVVSEYRSGPSIDATGTLEVASDGCSAREEREPLERVVLRADPVEVAAEPARAKQRVGLRRPPSNGAR